MRGIAKAKTVKELPTIEDACRFLATLAAPIEAKRIAIESRTLTDFARRTKDPHLLEWSVRVNFEAWRNLGRIIREMQGRGELIGPHGKGKGKTGPDGGTRKSLRYHNLSKNESSKAQWILDLAQKEYERRVTSITKKMVASLGAVFRQAMRNERTGALYAATEIVPGLHIGDFRKLSPKIISDESIQLVFIDPPYDDESLPLYGAAALEAARILKPGGSLITYIGQSMMPEIIQSMSKHLKYFWIGSIVLNGPQARMKFSGIIVGSKPLLWFVKDYRGDTQTWVRDTVISSGREKTHHEWQQALNEAEHFIEPLTKKDGTVVDFFVGGGTTLVAAKKLGRKYIGFEIDPARAKKAAERLDAT